MLLKEVSTDTLDSVLISSDKVKEFRNKLFIENHAGAIVAQDAFDLVKQAENKLSALHESLIKTEK